MRAKPICMKEIELARGELDVSVHRVKSDRRFPLHWHEYFELEIVLSGGGKHVCNGRQYDVSAGDAWLLSFYDFHSFEPHYDTEIINISFARDVLPQELESILSTGGFCGRLDAELFAEAGRLCRMLLRESNATDSLSVYACRSLIGYLTAIVLRGTGEEMRKMNVPSIRSAVAYMLEHFREDLSLTQVATAQGLTPNYFGNLFCEKMGISFREYLNKLRLRHACDLLSLTALSVSEIAHAAGYSSVEYFFNVFKKQLSVTPSQYRRDNVTPIPRAMQKTV